MSLICLTVKVQVNRQSYIHTNVYFPVKREGATDEEDKKHKNVGLYVKSRIKRCEYRGCKEPPAADIMEKQSGNSNFWSKMNNWTGFTVDGKSPVDYDNLTVPKGKAKDCEYSISYIF